MTHELDLMKVLVIQCNTHPCPSRALHGSTCGIPSGSARAQTASARGQILQLLAGDTEPGDEVRRVELERPEVGTNEIRRNTYLEQSV